MQKIKSRGVQAVILVVLAAIVWTVSVGMTHASSNPSVPDPPPCQVGCTSDVSAVSRAELATLLRNNASVSFAPANPPGTGGIEPNANCASVSSCGERLGCWKVFGGGSQYKYGNKIPACVRNGDRNCFDVKCYVKTYFNRNCSGEPDDEGWVDARGCKQQKTVVPQTPTDR